MWSNILCSWKSLSKRRSYIVFIFVWVFGSWAVSTEKEDFFAEREAKYFLVTNKTKIFQICYTTVIAVLFLFLNWSSEQSNRKYSTGLYFLRSFGKLLAYCPVLWKSWQNWFIFKKNGRSRFTILKWIQMKTEKKCLYCYPSSCAGLTASHLVPSHSRTISPWPLPRDGNRCIPRGWIWN